MSTRAWMSRVLLAPAVALVVLLPTGCGVDPSSLTLPGSGVHEDTYVIRIQFANALNLPSHARVMANGAQVGTLSKVTVVDPSPDVGGSVIAEVEIGKSVPVATDAKAQLRQDTILGDIYIGLELPASIGGPMLAPGDLLPITQTEPALQIEDVLSGLATFVSGGALRSVQDTVNQINAALPADPAETRRLADVLKNDLIDVAAHSGDLGAFLDSLDVNARLLLDNKAQFDEILTPQGVVDITGIAQTLIHVIGVIGALGGIAHALAWLAPLLTAGDATARAFVPMLLNTGRPLNLSAPSNLNRLVDFLRDKLIPWAERPTVNVLGVRVESSAAAQRLSVQEQTDGIVAALRMIGMVR
ncbi:MlaD family protein [Nocardia jejuensis]|uniref:MlaD family protein n=1 Tax=Nocardia jejuensis TaxID=328049 RepID=UPI000ACDBE0B|nr:MlaD family protein [Nocardia jejuensis]